MGSKPLLLERRGRPSKKRKHEDFLSEVRPSKSQISCDPHHASPALSSEVDFLFTDFNSNGSNDGPSIPQLPGVSRQPRQKRVYDASVSFYFRMSQFTLHDGSPE